MNPSASALLTFEPMTSAPAIQSARIADSFSSIVQYSKGKVCLLSPNKETQTPTSDVLSWLTDAID